MYKVQSHLRGTTYNGPEGGSTTQLISGDTKCKPFCGTECEVRCFTRRNPTKHKVYFTHPPCRRLSGPPCSDGRPNPSTRGMPASCFRQCLINRTHAHTVLEESPCSTNSSLRLKTACAIGGGMAISAAEVAKGTLMIQMPVHAAVHAIRNGSEAKAIDLVACSGIAGHARGAGHNRRP